MTGDDSALPFTVLYSLRSHILRHPTLSLLTAVAVATSVAMAVALEMSTRAVRTELDRTADAIAGSAVFEITGSRGVEEELAPRIAALPQVEAAALMIDWNVRVIDGPLQGVMLHIFGVDFTAERKVRDYSISNGTIEIRDPLRLLADINSVIVTQDFLDRSALSIGQQITVEAEGRQLELNIQGVLLPGGIADAYGGQIAAMDVFGLQELLNRRGWVDRIDITPSPGTDLDGLRDELERIVGGAAIVRRAATRNAFADRVFGTVGLAVWLIAVIGIVVATLLSYGAISHSVDRRTRQFALLQAVGLEPHRVRRIIWVDAALIGLLGTVLGLGLGIGVARILVIFFSSLSEFVATVEVREIHPGVTTIAIALVVGAVVSVVACIEPAYRATSRAPLEILTSTPVTSDGLTRARLLWTSTALLGIVLLVSLLLHPIPPLLRLGLLFASALGLTVLHVVPALVKGIRRGIPLLEVTLPRISPFLGWSFEARPAHTALTVGSIAGITAGLIGLDIVLESTDRSFRESISPRYPGALVVSANDPFSTASGGPVLSFDTVRLIRENVPFEAMIESFGRTMTFSGRQITIVARTMEVMLERGRMPVIEGTQPDIVRALLRGQVAVSQAFAQSFRVRVGDHIELPTASGPKSFAIAGVLRDFGGPYGSILLDLSVFDESWSRPGVTGLIVWPKTSQDALEDALRASNPGAAMFVMRASDLQQYMSLVLARFTSLLFVVGGMSALLGAIGVLTLMAGVTLERRRDLSLFRLAGATRLQTVAIILGDGCLTGVAGATVGLVLGVAVSPIMAAILEEAMGWPVDLRVPGNAILIAVGAIAAATLSALLPAWPAGGIGGAEALLGE